MSKVLLITRPNHDPILNCLFFWSKIIIEEAKRKGVRVLDLRGKKANRRTFESYIKKQDPALVVFNGHGSENTIRGHDNEVLVTVDENESTLSRKLVYARSCDSADCLGPKCIAKGVRAFTGYVKSFFLVYDPLMITHPLDDDVAKLFLEPSNLVPNSLLKGNTVGDSYGKSQKAMLGNVRFMVSDKASADQREAAPFLWENRRNQVLLGDPSVKL